MHTRPLFAAAFLSLLATPALSIGLPSGIPASTCASECIVTVQATVSEAEAKRLAEEERVFLENLAALKEKDEEEEAAKKAEAEAKKKAEADAAKKAESEQKRLADEAEAKRLADEEKAFMANYEALQKAEKAEAEAKKAAEAEKKRMAEEAEAKRLADEEKVFLENLAALKEKDEEEEAAKKAEAEAKKKAEAEKAKATAVVDPNTVCISDIQALATSERIDFASGSVSLTNASKETLRKIAERAKQCPTSVIAVEGHTDNVGPEQANMVISTERAKEVVEFLVSAGVGRDQLKAVGMGETTPAQTNDTREGRAANRRIEFKPAKS